MKRYINVKDNFVMFDQPRWFSVDCSKLSNKNIVFIGEDDDGFWYELTPFTGRNRNVNKDEIESIFQEAKTKFIEYRKSIKPTEIEIKIYNLKAKLKETDYKVLPDYDKPDDGIRAQRQAWREEIRKLEA